MKGCQWCKRQESVLQRFPPSAITVIPIERKDISPRWKISRFPTLVFTDDSVVHPKELARLVGFQDEQQIRQTLNKLAMRQKIMESWKRIKNLGD